MLYRDVITSRHKMPRCYNAMVRRTQVINVNSRPSSGALNVSEDGSSFDVKWQDPIRVPQQSNATLTTLHVEYWNTFRNIYVPATLWLSNNAASQHIPVIFQPGSYGLDELNNTLMLALATQTVVPAADVEGQILFSGEAASGRLAITFPKGDPWRVWMGDPSFEALRNLMGFSAQEYIPAPAGSFNQEAGRSYLADNRALLNEVTEIILHSDLVSSANTTLNGRTNMALAAVTPSVAVGSQRIWQAAIPVPIDVPGLEGATTSRASFWLTSQDGDTRVHCGGEDWGTTLLLSWEE
jgi:hypothetical protein